MHAQSPSRTSSGPAPRKETLANVLVVDDEVMILQALRRILGSAGYDVTICERPVDALELIHKQKFEVALLDVRMEGMTGIELLERIKAEQPEIEVVMMTAYGTPETAFKAVKLGAYDWLKKPFDNIDEVAHVIGLALEHRRLVDHNRYLESQVTLSERFEDLIGKSPAMRQVFELVESAAPSDASILIQGESGTGKELVARAIHRRSPRKLKTMVPVHCGAIAESLLASDLFGHIKGAFTGANQNRKGHFEVADGGTIFLDEIGEMNLSTQVGLLRALQEGEITRVGESEPRKVDVRAIAATNVDLAQAKGTGRFREDLYYRLNVISIRIPPLRERLEDIPILVHHFLRKYSEKMQRGLQTVSAEAMEAMHSYGWPGNVRELENVIEAAVVLARTEVIQLSDLSAEFRRQATSIPPPALSVAPIAASIEMPFAEAKHEATRRFERNYIVGMLSATDGNISEAARRSGLDRSNFRRVMLKYKAALGGILPDRD